MPLNQWSEDILIAELGDEPAFSDDVAALTQRLDQSGGEMPHVVIDLKSVTFLNSSNIAQLLRLRRKIAAGQRRLRICCVSDRVWSVMLITGLDKLFDFTDDVATSLASLQIGPK